MCESFAATSTHAHLVAYIDEDQKDLYAGLTLPERVRTHHGPHLGPIHAVNTLAHINREPYRIYGMVPDDARFLSSGWDDYALAAIDAMPGRIAVMSPAHSNGDYVNMPFVTREWIELVGWVAYPHAYHFIWDTILEILGDSTGAMIYAPAQCFLFHHHTRPAANMDEYQSDAHSFLLWCVTERRRIVEKVRAAILEATDGARHPT
jgi:hypothetical protein